MSATSSEAPTGSAGRRCRSFLAFRQRHQPVERPGDGVDRPGGDFGVDRGGVDLGMAEKHLNDADIDLLLEQMSGKAVPQRVRADAFADASDFGGLLNRTVRDRIGVTAPWEQPAMREHHPATFALGPPYPQQLQQLRREHGVAVPAALSLLNPDQHPGIVDIVDLQVRNFRHAQPSAISHAQRRLILDA